ncbi:MAG: ABC transporter permease [Bacteroidales bacterium]|nr:ABC transporter permease [Bacteroidales bacterium]MBR0287074.1 ABC transporter permease [Bacteroidales bacterium]
MKKTDSFLKTWFRNWYDIFVHELRLIFSDSGVMIIFFIGGLLYPVLYNLIYMNGTVDEMPVAVVDLSGGSCSRRYLQKVDATRECEILTHCYSLEEAQRLMQQRVVHGVILIPADFDERLVRGEQGVISTYADMSSFLYYKCLTMGTSLTMLDEIHQIQTERYAAAGEDGQVACQLTQPVLYDENIPFNKPFSYTIFFISAALMLVIQQTMFYGSSLLAGTLREQNRSFASMPRNLQGLGIGRVILGRGAAYMAVYLCISTLIALFIPWLFKFPQHAWWGDIMILLVFYIMDCIFFSFTWSTLIWKRETVFVLFLSVSPICMFLTGFSWPNTAIPEVWQWVGYLFPSTFGCRAFINLNTAGCSLADVAPEFRAMIIQTIVYYVLAYMAVFAENRYLARHSSTNSTYPQ